MSSPFFKICEIKNGVKSFTKLRYVPHFFEFQRGDDHGCEAVYYSVEIRPDSLENGSDPTDRDQNFALSDGIRGDCAVQLIGKKLGGCGKPCVPLNSQLDTSAWKADEDVVHAHVKQGGNRHAHLMFGFEYSYVHSDEIHRPWKIYRHFQLYENGEIVGSPIEGVFENTSPKLTDPETHCYTCCGVKYYFKDNKSK